MFSVSVLVSLCALKMNRAKTTVHSEVQLLGASSVNHKAIKAANAAEKSQQAVVLWVVHLPQLLQKPSAKTVDS
jgi:hypothetical protein